MNKILYFYPIDASFIKSDYQLLSKYYLIKMFLFKSNKKFLTPYYLLKQFSFLILNSYSSQLFLIQFSGYHSLLPVIIGKILKRKTYIILHGTECNNFPEYNYGYLIRPLLFWFSEKSLAWCTKILPVSESLVNSYYSYKDTLYVKQGLMNFYKNITTPIEVIYNGISSELFSFDETVLRDRNSFITVATGLDQANRRIIKGLDLIIELARRTPENKYIFIGGNKPEDLPIPSNINVIPYSSHIELKKYFAQSSFYIQISISEGFGIAVCEAMLCGCIPIVSNVGILPVIVGNNGYVLPQKNIEKLTEIVKQAITEYKFERAQLVRQHIIKNYSLQKREYKLLKVLSENKTSLID